MANSSLILEALAELSAQLPVLKNLQDAKLTPVPVTSNNITKVWRLETNDGKKMVIRSPNPDVDQSVVSEAIKKDGTIRAKLHDVSEGCVSSILASNKAKMIVVEEDTSDYEILQQRILLDDKVDHGITCNVARLAARIHKATHKNTIGEAKFNELSTQFSGNPVTQFFLDDIFVHPFQDSNLANIQNADLKKKARDLILSQEFTVDLNTISQLYNENKDCLIIGNLNTAAVLAKEGNIKLSDAPLASIGPCAFDLGSLVTDYVVAYYSQMLTEQENDRHRKVAYQMMDAIRKTVEAYTEENTIPSQQSLISQVAAFSGIQILRRVLWPCTNFIPISDSAKIEIFEAGWRLITRHNRIDNAGRLLMIGLQLC